MRRVLAGIAAATLIASAAACGTDGGSSGATTDDKGVDQVKVGVIPILDVAPIYLGKDKGFFSKRKIELALESGQGGAAIVPGVVSGQFQFGFSNITSLVAAQTRNAPVKVIAGGVASTGEAGADFGGVTVKANSPIKTAADLAGKKISVNTLKNIGDTTVRQSVRKAGGDPSKINFVEMPFPNAPAALEGGQVDASWVVEPQLSQIKAAGGRVVAWNFVDTAPDLTVAAYFTSTKVQAENADLVTRFTEAIKESMAYADAHPDEVRQILTAYTKIDDKTRAAVTLPKWPADVNKASVETLIQLGKQDGVFTTDPDLTKLLP
ncbi:MAG: ABC transporter substrate-binding protein [Actinoplanes sp.]